ncbi:MAG: hypothetical protein WDN50_15225 [Bradyrhizobium sp.]
MQFGIFIYDGVEPIDLATFGVLSMARRIAPDISICTIAPHAGPVALANGLKVTGGFRHRQCAGVRSRHRHRRSRLDRAGAGARDARLYPAGSRRAAHRVGVYRRHDPGGEWRAGQRPCDHQAREVVPPETSPIEVMRATYPQIDVRETMLVDTGNGRNRRRGLALHRYDVAFDRRYARPACRR